MRNPCIYKIICKDSDKIYLGSTVDLDRRLAEHFYKLRKNKHPNPILQNLYNKHGEGSLDFHVMEYCDLEVLREREQYYLDTVPLGINISKFATGGNVWSEGPKREEIIERIRSKRIGQTFNHTEQTKQKIREKHLGKIVSEETKEKLRQANLGKTRSLESKEKQSVSTKRTLAKPEVKIKMKRKIHDRSN